MQLTDGLPLGRLWATRQLCLVWIAGVIVFITANGNYGQVLAGRFIMGLGIGQTTVVAPAWVSFSLELVATDCDEKDAIFVILGAQGTCC